MKIDKTNPLDWILLFAFGLQAVIGAILRIFRRSSSGVVILYGHKLNGNLLALYRCMSMHPETGLRPIYLSMDRNYIKDLRQSGINARWACAPACSALLCRSAALVSDHGLHSLNPLRRMYQKLGLKFFDVWHGMSTMEYRPKELATRHSYDEVWVASDLYREVYIGQFGFDEAKVVITGHARTDRLVIRNESRDTLLNKYGLPLGRRLILFAPTWKQKSNVRSIYPFGIKGMDFLRAVVSVALKHDASVVMRAHLNSNDEIANGLDGLYFLPASRYPDTEAVLDMCDILICDWSTITFDWLLLDRPALFLDVEPPYPLGDFLGQEFRYGEVVSSLQMLLNSLDNTLVDPSGYWVRHGSQHQAAKDKFYGGMADGMAARRCVDRLVFWLGQ